MIKEIRNVFSKNYQEDVKYVEFKTLMRQYVKLKNESESIDKKIDRLKQEEYVSNCHIEVGEF